MIKSNTTGRRKETVLTSLTYGTVISNHNSVLNSPWIRLNILRKRLIYKRGHGMRHVKSERRRGLRLETKKMGLPVNERRTRLRDTLTNLVRGRSLGPTYNSRGTHKGKRVPSFGT